LRCKLRYRPFISGHIGPAAVSAASISFVALILAYCIRKEMGFKRTMAISIVVAAAVNAVIALVGAYLNYGTVSTAALLKPILDMIDALYGPALAGQAEAEAMLGEIKNMLTGSYVGYSVVASILVGLFYFPVGRWF
jgi:hypothetical protein